MMGESSACLTRSFSQSSSINHNAAEGDPIRALTSSISFGRYMSESLAWEKWSAFTHNRYMEEVERYSRPGSVAQMKAYFEAHYKRKAAERAAALSEQQNVAVGSSELNMHTGKQNDSSMAMETTQQAESPRLEINAALEVNACAPGDEGGELANARVGETEQPTLDENNVALAVNQLDNVEAASEFLSNKEDIIRVMDGAPRGDLATDKTLSSTKSVVCARAPKPPAPPPKPRNSLSNRLSIIPSLEKTAAYSSKPNSPAPHKPCALPKPTISLPNRLTEDASKPKRQAPPKPTISLPKKLDINAGPNCKKIMAESPSRKRETPKSLHMSINFASRETSKPLSPILQKIVNSRLVKTLVNKATKDRTNQQTPTWAYVDISKRPTVNTQQGNNRSRTYPHQSVFDTCKVEGDAQSPPKSDSKSPRAPGRKARSNIVSCAFSFKSEERALKRKEFFERLEQKQKTMEAEKEQLHVKSKEKARSGYKEIHRSVTSRPIQLSKLQGTETQTDPIKKGTVMQPCSPKLGRKTPSKGGIDSRPPWKFTTKTDGCSGTRGKINFPYYSAKSVLKTTMCENTSPNIQL